MSRQANERITVDDSDGVAGIKPIPPSYVKKVHLPLPSPSRPARSQPAPQKWEHVYYKKPLESSSLCFLCSLLTLPIYPALQLPFLSWPCLPSRRRSNLSLWPTNPPSRTPHPQTPRPQQRATLPTSRPRTQRSRPAPRRSSSQQKLLLLMSRFALPFPFRISFMSWSSEY